MANNITEEEMTLEEFLEHYGQESVDALAHYGVLGMKWGHRKSSGGDSGGGPTPKSRKELRSLDKASKASDKKQHSAEVDAARSRYNTSARKNYLDAKAQYKADKLVIGKREAMKTFNKVKDQNVSDYMKASEYRDGKEKAVSILGTAAAVVVVNVLAAAALKNG